jgi:hypothetical protein
MSVLVPCRCRARATSNKRFPKGPACASFEGSTTSGFLFTHESDKSLPCHSGVGVKLYLTRETSQVGTGRGHSVRTTRDGSRGRTRAKVETIPGFGRAAATPGFPALRVNGNMDLGTDSTLRALCLVALRPVLPYRTPSRTLRTTHTYTSVGSYRLCLELHSVSCNTTAQDGVPYPLHALVSHPSISRS